MSKKPRGRPGPGVDKTQGIGCGTFLAFVFLVLIVPTCLASVGVWASKFGQEQLRQADMEGLKTRLEEDPWLYSILEWFKDLELGTMECMLIWLSLLVISGFITWTVFSVITYHREHPSLQGGSGMASPSYSGSGYGGSSGSGKGRSQPETNPLFQAAKIERSPFSDDKTLKDASGSKVGSLSKALLSDDQIIRDAAGRKAGRISQHWSGGDKQVIKDSDDHKLGEIKSDWRGQRIIVDESGQKVGTIKKDFWGRTVIEGSGSGSSQSESSQPYDYGECYCCGEALDESGYCPNGCEEDEEE